MNVIECTMQHSNSQCTTKMMLISTKKWSTTCEMCEKTGAGKNVKGIGWIHDFGWTKHVG